MKSRIDEKRYASVVAVAVLLALVAIFYVRLDVLRGNSALLGLDYLELHMRRMAFARNSLLGHAHSLPGWYPHEFLGTPFAANLQSFPWIPTRLVLLLIDPAIAYAPGVWMAASLAAIFTYLYCRRAGLTQFGAVAAGGTFAGAGYFASRVMAGHLPLLEAYPSLPLLLWLVHRALTASRRHRINLAVLAVCSAVVVSAGHPQLPAYSLASALLYTAIRGRGWIRVRVADMFLFGAGLAFGAWWPMILLIGRSTRVLHLATAPNDVVMPYRRLWALVVPDAQGWPLPMDQAAKHLFTGFPNEAYFWDTAGYIGILPLIAVIFGLIWCVVQKRMPVGDWRFLAFLGTGALLCSLPLASPLLHLMPVTLLRSPARLLYLSTFCAAIALGVALDKVWQRWPRSIGILTVILALHFLDLWSFSHRFIESDPLDDTETPPFLSTLDREVGNGRIAEERTNLSFSYEDRYDDAGGFDSILLARFYRNLLPVAGFAPDMNREYIDASALPVKALEATGVRFVVTAKTRTDLQRIASNDDAKLYRVPNPAPRAESADYERPSSDEILLRRSAVEAGSIHVLESYDPGWTATVDGRNAPVMPSDGFGMTVPVAAGSHQIRMRYKTPGRRVGVWLSLMSLVLLAIVIAPAKFR